MSAEEKLMKYYQMVNDYGFDPSIESFMLEMGDQGNTSIDLNIKFLKDCNNNID